MPASGRIEELRKRYEENQRRFFAPLANEYRKSGDLEQAIDLCRMHLSEAPANLNGQIVFGQSLYEAGTLDEARTAFEAAIALDPENLIALRHLGDIGREQGNIPSARQWYRRVLDADRRNEDVLAIMDELTAIEAAGGSVAISESAKADAGLETIELDEPPMRAPAPSRPSIMSLIGGPPPSDQVEVTTVEVEATSKVVAQATYEAQAASDVESIAGFEATSVEEPEAKQAESLEHDAIDFGMVESGQEVAGDEPAAPPDSSFGFDVDLGAASDIPVATSAGDTGDFGEVELENDAPFRETQDIKPPDAETAADALLTSVDLQEPVDLDSFGTLKADAEESHGEPARPILALVRSDDTVDLDPADGSEDTIDLVPEDESADAIGLMTNDETATLPRRSTPVVFNFDLSVDEAPRTPTPFESLAAQAPTESAFESRPAEEPDLETEPDEEDIREMPTPIIQPAVEAFATETMAELYVKQGLRHEAIAVYRRLVDVRPNERALRDRLAELEDDGRIVTGSSAREFFAALSRRTSKGRGSGGHKLPDSPPPRGSLDRLFGDASVARLDERAAESLSAAFGSGPANPEESALDRVFNPRLPGR